jgi:sulfonate transport system substrate-binding protein
MQIRVGGVPEHYNFPWYSAIEDKDFESVGLNVSWKECWGGTGEMLNDIKEDNLDVIVALTEGVVKNILSENNMKIIHVYVTSPLVWGVHTHFTSHLSNLREIQGKKFAISRINSGSHLMSKVYAQQKNFSISDEDFIIVNDIHGARKSLASGETDVFLWEKYTAKPYVDSGEFKRIGEVRTPWPCFVVAASTKFIENHQDELELMLEVLLSKVDELLDNTDTEQRIAQKFGLKQEDVELWFRDVRWNLSLEENPNILVSVSNALVKYGVVENVEVTQVLVQ